LIEINEILKVLPHRYPFIMIDKVLELTDEKIVAIKNVTINEYYFSGHFPELPIMPGVLMIEALAQAGGVYASQFYGNNLKEYMLFSWLAFYAMWIYTTPAITQHVYGTTDSSSLLYNQGANWVGVLFAVYNGVSALGAFLLPVIARQIGRKATHAIALTLGGISLISLFLSVIPTC